MENEQRIKDEMFETRVALSEKLATLEQKVAGTVDQVTAVVSDTVEMIKDTVDDAKATAHIVNETVQESVKSVQKKFGRECSRSGSSVGVRRRVSRRWCAPRHDAEIGVKIP
jgi:ElaB/YqjD/DUF883 family membrane-anchored ribosome-binding protein